MSKLKKGNQKNIGRTLVVYLGSAWVFIEALNFLVDKYYWNSGVLDILILLIIFGLPAMVIYLWFNKRFTTKAIILHSLNLVIAVSVIAISLVNPGKVNPSQIRLIKFQNDQKKLAESVRSIAILPFSNFTGSESHTSLVAGLHDALIGEFGQIGAIRVMSRTSTLPYANSQKTVKSIASELNVDAILETSVLDVGNGIRIQVKLINAVPEVQLWSRTYDTELDNIMGLYNEIISNIASQIRLALLPDEATSLQQSSLVNPEAYKAYLEGVYQSEKLSQSGFDLSLLSFERSLKLDSMFAPVYAGIAFAWIGALQMGYVSVTEAIPQIYENNQSALNLDSNFPEAQYIKALMSFQGEWDWEKSEIAYQNAIKLNPNHVLSHAYYSHLLLVLKRFDEAVAELEKALELDPNNPLVLALYAVVLWHHGELDRALELATKSFEINSNSRLVLTVLQSIHYLKGDFNASMEILEILHGDDSGNFDSIINEYEEFSYESAMVKLAGLLQEKSQKKHLQIAVFLNRGGMHDEAIIWLERGVEINDPGMPYTFLPVELNNLRDDPRYAALAQRMNLPF